MATTAARQPHTLLIRPLSHSWVGVLAEAEPLILVPVIGDLPGDAICVAGRPELYSVMAATQTMVPPRRRVGGLSGLTAISNLVHS